MDAKEAKEVGRAPLLLCGILSSLLYVAMNVLVAMQWEGYSSVSQTVSELSAIGAPTRRLWVWLGIAYSLLVSGFGWGVWVSAGRSRPLRLAGGVMAAYGILGLAWPFAPMHLRGAEMTLTDTMHIVLAIVTVLLMLVAMGAGSAAFGVRFRVYSIASIALVLACGAFFAVNGTQPSVDEPVAVNTGAWCSS